MFEKTISRKAQAAKTKKKIYHAAVDLMDKQGFKKTTISQISKKAGVSVGAFYLYFKSKDDIFTEKYKLFEMYFEIEVVPNLTQENAFDQIATFFRAYAIWNKKEGCGDVRKLFNDQNKLFTDKERYTYQLLLRIIQEGQEKNQLTAKINAEEIAIYLYTIARGTVYDWCLNSAQYDIEERMIKNISWAGSFFKPQMTGNE